MYGRSWCNVQWVLAVIAVMASGLVVAEPIKMRSKGCCDCNKRQVRQDCGLGMSLSVPRIQDKTRVPLVGVEYEVNYMGRQVPAKLVGSVEVSGRNITVGVPDLNCTSSLSQSNFFASKKNLRDSDTVLSMPAQSIAATSCEAYLEVPTYQASGTYDVQMRQKIQINDPQNPQKMGQKSPHICTISSPTFKMDIYNGKIISIRP